MIDHFQMLARYNRIANERLYEACSKLEAAEYKKQRSGSFGSIHGLLNHILLGDQVWMSMFAGGGATTPPPNSILFDAFTELRSARSQQDAIIEAFFGTANDDFFQKSIRYTNNQGKDYVETALVAALHLFNHQTHHRGQVHVMLSQTEVKPPSLDLHRILNP